MAPRHRIGELTCPLPGLMLCQLPPGALSTWSPWLAGAGERSACWYRIRRVHTCARHCRAQVHERAERAHGRNRKAGPRLPKSRDNQPRPELRPYQLRLGRRRPVPPRQSRLCRERDMNKAPSRAGSHMRRVLNIISSWFPLARDVAGHVPVVAGAAPAPHRRVCPTRHDRQVRPRRSGHPSGALPRRAQAATCGALRPPVRKNAPPLAP